MEEVRGFKEQRGSEALQDTPKEEKELLGGEYVAVYLRDAPEVFGYYRGVEGEKVILTATENPNSRRIEYDTRGKPYVLVEQDKPEERFEALFETRPRIGFRD